MAKTINLTVKVDDAGFQQFMKNFNAFSQHLDQMNQRFRTINTTIQKTKQETQGIISFISSAVNASNKLYNATEKVFKGFMKIGTAIGGIVAMLTTGVGMFGIDRLAESIMQRRRQAMGLGTTRGGMLGFEVAGGSIFQDPSAMLQGIRTAMGGGSGMAGLMGLLGMGGKRIEDFGGDPAKAAPTVLKSLRGELQKAAPTTEVAVGRQLTTRYGLSGFADSDFVALKNMTDEQFKKLLEQIEATSKAADMQKKAQESWAALNRIFETAKVNLESAFGESLVKLTEPLGKLSKAFADLVKALLESKTVTDLINWLTKQLNKLTGELEKDPELIKKKLKEFDEYIEKEWMPVLRKLKEGLEGLANILSFLFGEKKDPEDKGGASDPMNWGATTHDWLKRHGVPVPGPLNFPRPGEPGYVAPQQQQGQQGSSTTTTTTTTQAPATQGPAPPVPGTTTSPATNVPPWARDRGQQGLFVPGNQLNQQFAMATGGRAFGGSAFGGPTIIGGANNRGSLAMGGPNASFMARGLNQYGGTTNVSGARNTSMGLAFGGSRGGDIRVGDQTGGDIDVRGGGRTRMFASFRGGNRIAMFGGAARGRVPGDEMNQFVTRVSGGSRMASVDNRRGLTMLQGPLDMDNWQMNRTPSLVLRNVPGSNIHAQTTGMA